MTMRLWILSVLVFFIPWIKTEDFELLNKLSVPVEFVLGSGAEPLARKYEANQLVFIEVKAGDKSKTITVDNKKTPQMLIREKGKQGTGLLYEFQAKPGKKVFVRILEKDGGTAVEPQTYVYNSLTKDDVVLLKTFGVSQKQASTIDKSKVIDIANSVTSQFGIDLKKFLKAVETTKADSEQLKSRVTGFQEELRKKSGPLNQVKESAADIKKMEAIIKNDLIKVGYTKTELISALGQAAAGEGYIGQAVAGVTSLANWVSSWWSSPSVPVKDRTPELKKKLEEVWTLIGTIKARTNLDLGQELVIRLQKMIDSAYVLIDDVIQIKYSLGSLGAQFVSDKAANLMELLKQDLIRVAADMGKLVSYKSMLAGGPLTNTQLTAKIGGAIVTNIFEIGKKTGDLVDTIQVNVIYLDRAINTIEEEAKIIKDSVVKLQVVAKKVDLGVIVNSIFDQITTQITVEKILIEALKNALIPVKEAFRYTLAHATNVVYKIVSISDRIVSIGKGVEQFMGAGFLKPEVMNAFKALSTDLMGLTDRVTALSTELGVVPK